MVDEPLLITYLVMFSTLVQELAIGQTIVSVLTKAKTT